MSFVIFDIFIMYSIKKDFMKIENAPKPQVAKKLSNEDIKAKLKEKFGDKIKSTKPKKIEDKVEIREQSLDVHQTATVGKNDPNSSVTRDKLKDILKTGAFDFKPHERKALAQILQ